jgi:hypothetical protein
VNCALQIIMVSLTRTEEAIVESKPPKNGYLRTAPVLNDMFFFFLEQKGQLKWQERIQKSRCSRPTAPRTAKGSDGKVANGGVD